MPPHHRSAVLAAYLAAGNLDYPSNTGAIASPSASFMATTDTKSEPSSACFTPKTISTSLNTEEVPLPLQMSLGQEHFPQAGKTFLIRARGDKDKDLVLEQAEGEVRVSPRRDTGLGVAWHCVKTKNWLGFRNSVSGQYLQRPDAKSAKAQGAEFNELAWFVVERHRQGGYVMMGLDPLENVKTAGLLQVAISLDGRGLTTVEEGGTAWDFIEIDDVDVAYNFARHAA